MFGLFRKSKPARARFTATVIEVRPDGTASGEAAAFVDAIGRHAERLGQDASWTHIRGWTGFDVATSAAVEVTQGTPGSLELVDGFRLRVELVGVSDGELLQTRADLLQHGVPRGSSQAREAEDTPSFRVIEWSTPERALVLAQRVELLTT